MPEFEPSPNDFYIYLTTTNRLAADINSKQLAKLKNRLHTFTGSIEGEFGEEYLPTAIDLQVKVGAQIMMLNNDAEGRWVNGSIVFRKPILKHHVWMDYKVVNFLTKYQYKKAEQSCPVDDKIEIIRRAIRNKAALQIVYLKPNDEKTRRVIKPETVGEMEYRGKTCLGVQAFYMKRNEERVFRIDRILEINEV